MIEPHGSLIFQTARSFGLDPCLVAAVVCAESSGNPYAIKPELGFWTRYLSGILDFVRRSPSKRDDRWAQYNQIYSCSYGLMQILYQTARELGFDPQFPTELCGPMGVQAGCAKLKKCLTQSGGSVRQALLKYNGGGDPEYPDRVLTFFDTIVREQLFK